MNRLPQKHAAKLRFAIVGGFNTLVDFGLLFILTNVFAVPKLPANIASTSVAFVFSFFANKKFTFKSHGNQQIIRQLLLFSGVTLFGLWVIQSIIIASLTPTLKQLGLDDNLALLSSKLVATVASLLWNYLLYSRLVFKNPETSEK